MEISIINGKGEEVGKKTISDAIFNADVRGDILARVVHWQEARKRAGTHQAKERSFVSGSTKKIFKQKGTGNARHGSRKAPQFRSGGVVFGPVVRDHGYSLPKKVRKLGLKMALSLKAKEGRLCIIDKVGVDTPKVKDMRGAFSFFDKKKALFVRKENLLNAAEKNFQHAIANIHTHDFLPQIGLNVRDILKKDYLVMSQDVLEVLEGRLA